MKRSTMPARRTGAWAVRELLRAAFALRFAMIRFRWKLASPGHTGSTSTTMESCSGLQGSVRLVVHLQPGRSLGTEANEFLISRLVFLHPPDGLVIPGERLRLVPK